MKKLLILAVVLSISVGFVYSQPKVSSWDGVAYCVKTYLKSNLHDPKSLKIQDAYNVIEAGEDYVQRVTYRAKNGFGGLVLEDKVFFMKKSSYSTNEFDEYVVYDVMSYTEFKRLLELLSK